MRQLGARQQLHDPRRQIARRWPHSDFALFRHLDVLSQLVANSLQPLAHRRFVHACLARQPTDRPAPVVPAVA
jgi:hypothetical protein